METPSQDTSECEEKQLIKNAYEITENNTSHKF